MKKNKLFTVAALSLCLLLTGCDDIVANPSNGDSPLVNFTEGKEYFQNDYQKIYDSVVSGGTINTYTLEKLVQSIAADIVDNSGFFQNVNVLKKELVDEAMLTKVNSDTYKKNGKFYESLFINQISKDLYTVTKTSKVDGIYVRPDSTIADLLGADYFAFDAEGNPTGPYAEYVTKEVLPEINEKLLTAKYICETSFSALGRAYARKVSYVKLENIEKKPGAASKLLTAWLGDFINNKTTTTEKFDLDSLARLYKGLPQNEAEEKFLANGNYYTLSDQIEDEIAKVADFDSTTNTYKMKMDKDIDTAIENKYTGNGAYPLEVGYSLALGELSGKQISDNDLYTKTNGISDLPTSITDRIFSSNIASYTKTVTVGAGEGAYTVTFLTPASTENGDDLGQYYFYDAGTGAYYIVVVENYSYSSTKLKEQVESYINDEGVVTQVTNEIARIAIKLADSSTYKTNALLELFEEYGVANNIHDQTFYDYMEENYADIFED